MVQPPVSYLPTLHPNVSETSIRQLDRSEHGQSDGAFSTSSITLNNLCLVYVEIMHVYNTTIGAQQIFGPGSSATILMWLSWVRIMKAGRYTYNFSSPFVFSSHSSCINLHRINLSIRCCSFALSTCLPICYLLPLSCQPYPRGR